jgi:hypothetical protein
MALARRYDLNDYSQPAGGCCFLTNKHYAAKLSDLWLTRGRKDYELDDIMLLKVGRHLRPRPNFKLIIGREEGENNFLNGYRQRYTHIRILSHEGPTALLEGYADNTDLKLAAQVVARFSQGRMAPSVKVHVAETNGETRTLDVVPLSNNQIPSSWYIGAA